MNLLSVVAGMFNQGTIISPGYVGSTYRPCRIHATKKGPGRSDGMKRKINKSGTKIFRKAFNGMLGIRGQIGSACRLAIS